jgi:hypothetical protein
MKFRSLISGSATALKYTVLCGWAMHASAELLPAITGFPAVSFANGLSAVRYQMSGAVTIINPDPVAGLPPAADGFSEQGTLFISDFKDSFKNDLSAGVQSGTAEGTVIGRADAGFGKLRASAVASGGGGYIDAVSQVKVSFIDMVEVGGDNTIAHHFDIDWKVDGSVQAVTGRGGAAAFAQLWVFPFGPLPQALGQFEGTSYRGSFWQVGQSPIDNAIGTTDNLEPGSRYWIYGELLVLANRNERDGNVVVTPKSTSRADFMDTVQLFIDPSSDSPGSFLISAAGYDYTSPIPEPTSWLMLCAGLSTIMLSRRRMVGQAQRAA